MSVKKISKLEDITPDRRNANKGTVRGRALLEDSLRKYGAGRSIVVDSQGETIGGAKTLEVAAELGLKIRVVPTDGNELVVVQRTDLTLDDATDNRARELAYADNRVAALDLEWDRDVLSEDAERGIDLDAVGFRDEELKQILASVDGDPTVPQPDEQREPQPKSEAFVEIYCTREQLEGFKATLADWSALTGVTINIS